MCELNTVQMAAMKATWKVVISLSIQVGYDERKLSGNKHTVLQNCDLTRYDKVFNCNIKIDDNNGKPEIIMK